MSTLLLYLIILTAEQINGQFQRVLIYPNDDDQIFKVGSTLNLTCTIPNYSQRVNLTWTQPGHKNEKNYPTRHRLSYSYSSNETHYSSTLTLKSMFPSDTGYYSCVIDSPNINFAGEAKKYVYVYDSEHPINVVNVGQTPWVLLQQGEPGIFPCIATHPEVVISFYRLASYDINGEIELTTEQKSEDLLSRNHSRWAIDRVDREGLTLKYSMIEDSGLYQCIGKMNESKTELNPTSVLVKGMELTTFGGSDDPLEGTDVTLVCRNSQDFSPLVWYQIGDFGELELLNSSNLPEGINMTTTNQVGRTLWGTTLQLEESLLQVFEVRLNSSIRFQCTGNDGADSKMISLRVKEMNNETVNVQLDKGRLENLTCVRASEKHEIQWLKNGETYFGIVQWSANSSVLPLLGSQDDIGIYTCHWNNSLSEARFKLFNVTYVEEETEPETETIAVSVPLAILLLIAVAIGVRLNQLKRQALSDAEKFLKGNSKNRSVEEQTEHLPYDKRWEFPRHRLTIDTQLGVGCFGLVMKAKAEGLKGSNKTSCKTVAVKMPKAQNNTAALQDLIGELKVMIHLGSHLNVLNLLGACTKRIHKGEILIIVEYCQFGNLQNYLIRNRKNFINQLDELGNLKTDSDSDSELNGYLLSCSSVDEVKNQCETDIECRSIATKDLVSWSFQIARGMDYLSSKKVLHGDLAARNVLLADKGVVKVSDFGMSRKMYYEINYEKKGQALMPVKWMAPESLTDRILSTESDVWSYGILLWELFSLGKVPYPGIETKQLIQELENGYRMEKPNYAPNFIGEIMMDCWKKKPNERPNFRQLERTVGSHMESSVSSFYSNLNAPYEKFNYEKTVAPKTEPFGLAKMLKDKSLPQSADYVVRYTQSPDKSLQFGSHIESS